MFSPRTPATRARSSPYTSSGMTPRSQNKRGSNLFTPKGRQSSFTQKWVDHLSVVSLCCCWSQADHKLLRTGEIFRFWGFFPNVFKVSSNTKNVLTPISKQSYPYFYLSLAFAGHLVKFSEFFLGWTFAMIHLLASVRNIRDSSPIRLKDRSRVKA